MIHKIARFKAKEFSIQAVLEDIKEFISQVNKHEPETVYTSYQLDDELSFMHIMSFPDADAENAHRFAEYTEEFVEKLYPNCQDKPVFSTAKILAEDKK